MRNMNREEYWSLVKEVARELGIGVKEARRVVRALREDIHGGGRDGNRI